MIILGIGGILGDAATAIVKDGQLVAAVEEVKVSRQYRVGALPEASIAACLSMAGAKPEEVESVAIVRPLAAYSIDATEWGQGWQCANCLGMGRERFRVSHAPGCPFAMIPPEIDIPPQEGLRAEVEERVLK